jgi:sugar phosphate isomerase/epimerase
MLDISIITSIDVNGLDHALQSVPLKVKFCDLYGFMQNDLAWLDKNSLYTKVVQYMDSRKDDQGHIQGVAQEIRHKIAGCRPNDDFQLRIAAFATFIPEISSEDQTIRLKAQGSLIYLVRLARELANHHPVRTIELVGGTLLRGLHDVGGVAALSEKSAAGKAQPQPSNCMVMAELEQDGEYVASIIDEETALRRLCESLLPVAKEAVKAASKIQLGLELEPGPFYVLGSWNRIQRFCRLIDAEYPQLATVVGLNLDIPHWGILGHIRPETVEQDEQVFKKIIHSHLSDHAKGHFCDDPLHLLHSPQTFLPWIQLLMKRQKANGECILKYSGFITLELEACKNVKMIERSVKELENLLIEISQKQ